MNFEQIKRTPDTLCAEVKELLKQRRFAEVDELLQKINIRNLSFGLLIALLEQTFMFHEKTVSYSNLYRITYSYMETHEETCSMCKHIFHGGDLRTGKIHIRSNSILCYDCYIQGVINDLALEA